MNLIVARGKNNEIGQGNDLLWSLPTDMKFFREKTMGNTIVMGRKTWESIGEKPLWGRKNIVLTNRGNDLLEFGDEYVLFMNEDTFRTYHNHLHDRRHSGEIFLIGGGEIYRRFASLTDVMYITDVEQSYPEADTFFNFPKENWVDKATLLISEDNGIKFTIRKYERV